MTMQDEQHNNLRVLLIEDDEDCRDFLATTLKNAGMQVTPAFTAEEAVKLLKKDRFDIITTDMNLPGDMDGLSLLKHVREHFGEIPLILITGFSSVHSAVEALKLGAYDYLIKPLEDTERLVRSVQQAVREHKLEIQNKKLRERLSHSQKMEYLAKLAGGVAHDLNNVLSPIVALPDLVREEIAAIQGLDPIQKARMVEDLASIKNCARRASGVVKDLLASSSIGNYEKQVEDVTQVVRDCLEAQDIADMKLAKPDVVLEVTLEKAPLPVRCSRPHIIRSIGNVLRNAFEAMEKDDGTPATGGKKIAVAVKRAHFDGTLIGHDVISQGEYAVVEISDTGTGISKENMDRIFEPFFSTKRQSHASGSGLGLSIVYGVVKDHHGFVDVASEVGKGATFRLHFPLTEDAKAAAEGAGGMELKGGTEHVIVVDDEPHIRRLATRQFGRLGYKITTASCGREAVGLFEAAKKEGQKCPFDLIVLDMIMEADFDGLSTYKAIVNLYPDVPVIISSGYAPTQRVTEAMAMGAGWLQKPYDINEMAKNVRDMLDSAPAKTS